MITGLAAVGCSKADDTDPGGLVRVRQLEAQGIQDGVSINIDYTTYEMTIDTRAVGCTNGELSTAIQLLRSYRVAYQNCSDPGYTENKSANTKVIDSAIIALQQERTNLLTKNTCATTN